MPVATAHRQVATLVEQGYLAVSGVRRHIAGPRLLDMLFKLDQKQVIASCAAPVLHQLAVECGLVVQLGTLENDMVTYRLKAGQGEASLFTRVGMQLEAYCSGLGKVLLAYLPENELRAYLGTGPFPPLTAQTITNPDAIANELAKVRKQGFAIDQEEVSDGLVCVAVPIIGPDGRAVVAISTSKPRLASCQFQEMLPALKAAAAEIERRAFGSWACRDGKIPNFD